MRVVDRRWETGDADLAVPVMRPVLPSPSSIAAYLAEMDRSGRYSNFGPLSLRLEERMASRLGVAAEQVVAVANATLGIAGSLVVADAASWTLPSWSFTATAAAARLAAVDVAFADVGAADWWMVPGEPCGDGWGRLHVAPFGDGLDSFAWDEHGETVVDAAASLGMCDGPLGHLPPAAAVVFSLHATKVLGAGEGGIAVFGDVARAEAFRSWTNYGFAGTRTSGRAGINAKMSEPAAACALAALDGWTAERYEWAAARALVDDLLAEVGLPQAPGQGGRISPYAVVVLPDRPTLEVAAESLAAAGVGTRRWWGDGCHRMPAYRDVPSGPLEVTDRLADTVLGLPMWRGLGPGDCGRILRGLERARSRTGAW